MEPLISAQHNIRHNAEELQDFLRDLNQWKEEMTRKDIELKNQMNTDESILQPIRSNRTLKSHEGNELKKRKKKNQSDKATVCSKPKRISSSDYEAWNRFDVDKACEELDNENNEENEDNESNEETEDFEEIRRKDEALEAKEKGNELFKLGKFEQAIECYTRGLLCDPKNPILPANRALVLLKLERYGAAEQDCELAISLDKSYVKAFQRRASARMALKKYNEAATDLQTVLKLQPKNKQALEELGKLKKLQEEISESSDRNNGLKNVKTDPNIDNNFKKIVIEEYHSTDEEIKPVGKVFPVHIPPHLRSKKPLKRMRINEITGTLEKKPDSQMNTEEEKEEIQEPTLPPRDNYVRSFTCPTTAFQFQSDWKQLRNSKELLYQYLKNIPFENYSHLFQHSLESHILSDILYIYLHFYINDGLDVYDGLVALSEVQRFKTLLMFFSAQDKIVLQSLFDILAKQKSLECLQKLVQLYSI